MAKTVIIDELHLTIRIPVGLEDTRAEAIRRTLTGRAFMARLRHAIRTALQTYSSLAHARMTVTR